MSTMREEIDTYQNNYSNKEYNYILDGFIQAIRIYDALGTTMACIKTPKKMYYVNWKNRSQREMFCLGINEDTTFFDERNKPLFYEV